MVLSGHEADQARRKWEHVVAAVSLQLWQAICLLWFPGLGLSAHDILPVKVVVVGQCQHSRTRTSCAASSGRVLLIAGDSIFKSLAVGLMYVC